ncbi:MAG: hypothetical protein N2559_03520 [Anaerolineae bacterium]|nr:hypothetical protein [Anaerolineae bacterium]
MSEPLSRRDFFAFLANPLTRVAKSISADEQRRRNLAMLQRVAKQCARCDAPFVAQADEDLCARCRDADAPTRALRHDVFHNESAA